MQPRLRLVGRLDIKAPNVVKGVQMEGFRKYGDPVELARTYYLAGIDELLYIDVVASLYDRHALVEILTKVSCEVFVPLTVAGRVRSREDARSLLSAGADKVAVNTGAVENPQLISELSEEFGRQSVVLSIEAKKTEANSWELLTHTGRSRTGIDAVSWASRAEELGAGELLVTSVDRDGTKRGLDTNLIKAVCNACTLPVTASGGVGRPGDLPKAIDLPRLSAIAIGRSFHDGSLDVSGVRQSLTECGYALREVR